MVKILKFAISFAENENMMVIYFVISAIKEFLLEVICQLVEVVVLFILPLRLSIWIRDNCKLLILLLHKYIPLFRYEDGRG